MAEKIKIPLTNPHPSVIIHYANEGIAQLVEHLLDVQGVIGSSPIILTKTSLKLRRYVVWGFFICDFVSACFSSQFLKGKWLQNEKNYDFDTRDSTAGF